MPQPSEKQRQAGLWHPRENWATTLQAKSFLGQNEGVEFLPEGKESHSKPKTKSGVLSQTVNSRGKNMKMSPRVMEKPVAEIRYHLETPEALQGREQGRGAMQRLRNQSH